MDDIWKHWKIKNQDENDDNKDPPNVAEHIQHIGPKHHFQQQLVQPNQFPNYDDKLDKILRGIENIQNGMQRIRDGMSNLTIIVNRGFHNSNTRIQHLKDQIKKLY